MSTRILSITLLLLSVCLCFQASAGNRRHAGRRPPPPPCCVKVSTENITSAVTGNTYRKQSPGGPCVEAVIFNTRRGEACADPNSKWVKTLTANMTKK
ncbi:eotaxin-like [Morone saxatilis]|uniref:eotaxin-like n=1 Tax=Morone saxatilis TaxID=34816 RepID=UPI0015E213C0|nr:eotaxin-like [Morone saxatilis]